SLRNAGKYMEAIGLFERSIGCQPRQQAAYAGLADCLKMLKHHGLANDVIRWGITWRPLDGELWNQRAITMLLANIWEKHSDVKNALDRAFLLAADNAGKSRILGNLAFYYSSNGDIVQTLKSYVNASRLDPENPLNYQNILMNLLYLHEDEPQLETLIEPLAMKSPVKLLPECSLECAKDQIRRGWPYAHTNSMNHLYARVQEQTGAKPSTWPMTAIGSRKVRIAYIGADFHGHA
ncbi:hypothetical protein HDU93_006764, partial [Gonapodya sp. JEL0774]